MRCRNLSRASLVLARAFADHYFQENEEIFEAEWSGQMKELLEVAKAEREKRSRRLMAEEAKCAAPDFTPAGDSGY